MTWAADRRLDYIDLLLLTQGRVRRDEIQAAFAITQSAASGDIRDFLTAHPDAMSYDKSAKQYVPAREPHKPAREAMTDPARRKALLLLVGH